MQVCGMIGSNGTQRRVPLLQTSTDSFELQMVADGVLGEVVKSLKHLNSYANSTNCFFNVHKQCRTKKALVHKALYGFISYMNRGSW